VFVYYHLSFIIVTYVFSTKIIIIIILTAAQRQAKEESDRKAKEESDRKAKEEADRKAKEESDRRAKEEEEALGKARIVAELSTSTFFYMHMIVIIMHYYT